jgi:purine nucleosidase
LQPVLDFAEVWFARSSQTLTFHDPLAAAALFAPLICTFEPGRVEVELQSDRLRGLTHWQAGAAGPHQVALQVEPQRFFDHFFSTLNQAGDQKADN